MRLILVSLFLIIYSFFTIPMCAVEWAAGRINPQKKAIIAQKCVVAGFKIILFISGVRLTVKGEENILHDRAALYTYNHRGFFDILVDEMHELPVFRQGRYKTGDENHIKRD